METLRGICRSHILLRICPILSQSQTVPKRIITNRKVGFTIKRSYCNRAEGDIRKYHHDVNFHTDGVIKTVISNARDLFCELRDEFKKHRGFNIILITVIVSYTIGWLGKLTLEYRKDKREEKQMQLNHKFRMKELELKQPTPVEMPSPGIHSSVQTSPTPSSSPKP